MQADFQKCKFSMELIHENMVQSQSIMVHVSDVGSSVKT